MADKKISALAAATAATGGDIAVVQGGTTKKLTVSAAGALVAEAADAAAQRTGLGLGTAAVEAASAFATAAQGLTADSALQPNGDGSGLSGVTKPSDLGTAAALDAGTGDGDVVQVQTGGKLPALDGSNLTNLPGGGGGGITPWVQKTANYTAVTGDMLECEGTFDVTLPASPAGGDTVMVASFGTITLKGNGQNFQTPYGDGTDEFLTTLGCLYIITSAGGAWTVTQLPSVYTLQNGYIPGFGLPGVKIASSNYTVGSGNPRELYGGLIYVDTACIISAPPVSSVAEGASFTVFTIGAIAVSVDVDAGDKIYRDGDAQADGEKITNLSTAGDMAVFTYYSADGWHASTNGWTNGG